MPLLCVGFGLSACWAGGCVVGLIEEKPYETFDVLSGSRLGRAPSTISRELARNGGRAGYRAHRADWLASHRPGDGNLCVLGVGARPLGRQRVTQGRWLPETGARVLLIVHHPEVESGRRPLGDR